MGGRLVTIAPSGGLLAEEYRAIDDGIRRTPPLSLAFDPDRWEPGAVAAARRAWTQRMALEYRSTTVFGALASQLFDAGAAIDAQVVMLRMAQDELRHTVTCGEVVAALGGEPCFDADVTVAPLARHGDASPEERALRNVLYTTCLSETVAVARLADELEATKDPFLREATRRLLADEVLHGQFGFRYLEAWRPWLRERPEVVRSLERYLRLAFAVLERELVPPEGTTARLSADELALGLAPYERGREIFYEVMKEAVVPGLEHAGLDAGRAFHARAA